MTFIVGLNSEELPLISMKTWIVKRRKNYENVLAVIVGHNNGHRNFKASLWFSILRKYEITIKNYGNTLLNKNHFFYNHKNLSQIIYILNIGPKSHICIMFI